MHMRLNAVRTNDMNASSATPVVSAMSDGPHVNIIPKQNKIKKYVRRVNAQNLKKAIQNIKIDLKKKKKLNIIKIDHF